MDKWIEIRERVLVEGESKRQVLDETGMHWQTLEKILSHSAPPGYRMKQARPKKKIGPYLAQIEAMLRGDQDAPPKQRHTAKRIYVRLREAGYAGGYTQVKEAVRELRRHRQEVFVPLVHRAGEAQVDFGHAYVKWNGVLVKVAYIAVTLPYSDVMFVRAYERECTETFWDGHVHAFAFFGGVPWRISYDNTSIAVKKIIGRERKLTDGFLRLRSHYLFKSHFCQPARGNEKGVVEGVVGFARRNFMVPVPEITSLEQFNAELLERCRLDMERKLRGQEGTKAELLKADQAAFRALPASPFEAAGRGRRRPARSRWCDSTAMTTRCRWSLRTAQWWSKASWSGWRSVARPRPLRCIPVCGARKTSPMIRCITWRCWSESQRAGACTAAGRMGTAGVFWRLASAAGRRVGERREARVYPGLRLLERHSESSVAIAIEKGLAIRAHTRDAIAQFLLPQEEWRATTFTLDKHPHLRLVQVASPDLFAYAELRRAGGER